MSRLTSFLHHKRAVLTHILFNIGFWTFLWGAYEQAYQNGQPIWSGTFGFPVPHHYLVGAGLAYFSYILLTYGDHRNGKNRKQIMD